MYTSSSRRQWCFILLLFNCALYRSYAQDYEVADIDCAVGTGGKELLTAKLRKPDGFRGTPIFADDRGTQTNLKNGVTQDLLRDGPCQIYPDATDLTNRVFNLRVTDFTQCGVLKRNGFIHVRVWFPQLPGVVMLSDQEVIIMCKPPQPTVTQSKAAGFAGSIPSGARVSGVVEETPGRLEYEVALFREASPPQGRAAGGAFITGVESHELPVDQAVPIGTRLQLRAKINPDSAWQHAKLMEVSVSPDPKDASADGSVALIRDGCRNPDLASIIPKQPYRYKERSNEVVLDFEAFLLSNMGDRNTLWLHTQIKACMESQDCHPEFCMDVYQPSGFGKRRRRNVPTTMVMHSTNTTADYSAPLSQRWKTVSPGNQQLDPNNSLNETETDKPLELELSKHHIYPLPLPPNSNRLNRKTGKGGTGLSKGDDTVVSTKFGDNIGFSVIMPADYYRSAEVITKPYECKSWATATLCALLGALIAGVLSCVLSYKLRRVASEKERSLYNLSHQAPVTIRVPSKDSSGDLSNKSKGSNGHGHHHHHHHKYARDSSVYRS